MDNRTIRRAITKRVPEIYFIFPPIPCICPVDKRPAIMWRMLANIPVRGKKNTLFKLAATMPRTALVSHKELLNTMINEIYDEVLAIKKTRKTPEMMPQEKDWTPLSEDDMRALGITTIEDMLMDNPQQMIQSHIEIPVAPKKEKPKLIGFDK